ncbi:hypothetical protein H8D85_02220 [bacterium]|nr:hypothetical protein [bacterium]
MDYKCKKCKTKKSLQKTTSFYIDGEWRAKESICEKCGKYMDRIKNNDSTPNDFNKEGMNIIRTEPTHRRKH